MIPKPPATSLDRNQNLMHLKLVSSQQFYYLDYAEAEATYSSSMI